MSRLYFNNIILEFILNNYFHVFFFINFTLIYNVKKNKNKKIF